MTPTQRAELIADGLERVVYLDHHFRPQPDSDTAFDIELIRRLAAALQAAEAEIEGMKHLFRRDDEDPAKYQALLDKAKRENDVEVAWEAFVLKWAEANPSGGWGPRLPTPHECYVAGFNTSSPTPRLTEAEVEKAARAYYDAMAEAWRATYGPGGAGAMTWSDAVIRKPELRTVALSAMTAALAALRSYRGRGEGMSQRDPRSPVAPTPGREGEMSNGSE